MTTTPPEPPMGGGMPQDPNAGGMPPGYGAPPPGYGAPGGMPPAAGGQWMGPALAEWPARLGAWLIDGIIIGLPSNILSRISPLLGFLWWIGALLYLSYMQGTTGQTVGKQVLKIKLLKEADGQVIGFGMAFIRYFLHFIVDGLPCLIGFLWPLWDSKKQTFADKILQTVVIKV